MALDFGNSRTTIDRLLREYMPYIELAERFGFDSISAGEAYPTDDSYFHLASPLIVLASLAPMTGLRLATGVTLLPGWHPLRLAYDGAILDQVSAGRLMLGIGVGQARLWHRFGIDPDTVGDRMDDLLKALKVLWAGASSYDGKVFSVEGPIRPLPVQVGGPPLLVGGFTQRAARRSAEMDGWFASTNHNLDQIRHQVQRYYSALSSAGKTGADANVVANRITVIGPTSAQALEQGRESLEHILRLYARSGGLTVANQDGEQTRLDGTDPLLLSRSIGGICLVGSPADVRSQLEQYAAAGVNQVQLRVVPGDMPPELVMQTIRLAGEEVLPAFS